MTSSLFTRLKKHIRERGLLSVFWNSIYIIDNFLYDGVRRTDTSARVELDTLSVTGPNKSRGVRYEPTPRAPFLWLLRTISPPTGSRFVDVGCGKGKVLLMAMEYGFTRLAGIDFSPELCEIAGRNVAKEQRRTNRVCNVEIIECDAADYVVSPEDSVFFLFNPFDDVVMDRFISGLMASASRYPRDMWILYYNPVHSEVLDKKLYSWQSVRLTFRGSRYVVYSTVNVQPPSKAHSSTTN